jgi:hypothetical protein
MSTRDSGRVGLGRALRRSAFVPVFLWAIGATPAWAKGPFTISQRQANPGEVLTISGRTLHPKGASVVFTDGAGRETLVPASAEGRHTIAFAVPPFLDVDQFRITAGTVRVAVQQGSSRIRRPVIDALEIASLPTTGAPPGTLTVAVLDQLAHLADVTLQNLKTIEASSGGRVDVSNLRSSLLDLQQQFLASKSLFEQVMSGSISRIPMGQLSGRDVFVDLTSLELMDQLYAAYVFNGHYPRPSQSHALFKPLDDMQQQEFVDQFSGLYTGIARDIASFANRYDRAFAAATGVATLGLVSVAGAPIEIALGAAAVMGCLVWNATTWVPAAQMAALEGGSRLMIEGHISLRDFRQSTEFLFERLTGKLIDKFTEAIAGAASGQEQLVQIEKHLLSIAEATVSDGGRVVRHVRRSYREIIRGLSGCTTGGCCPVSKPVDCGTFCCFSTSPVCGSDGSCSTLPPCTGSSGLSCNGGGCVCPLLTHCAADGTCLQCIADTDCLSDTGQRCLPNHTCGCPSDRVDCGGGFCCPAGTACILFSCVTCSAGRTPCGQSGCCPPDEPVCGADSRCHSVTTSTTMPGGGGGGCCVYACQSPAACRDTTADNCPETSCQLFFGGLACSLITQCP